MKKGLTRMSFKVKMLITGMLILLIGVIGIVKFSQSSTISANEDQVTQSVINADSQSDVVQALNDQVLNSRISALAETSEPRKSTLTEAEMNAANDAANAAVGFNPLANVATVTSWLEFRAAYNDSTVTKIVMANDISSSEVTAGNRTTTPRADSIEIDGQGHTLELISYSLYLRTISYTQANTANERFMHVHHLNVSMQAGDGIPAFIGGNNGYGAGITGGWRFRTGFVSTNRGTTGTNNGVGRFFRGSGALVTVYGDLDLDTAAENFYAGSLIVEDKTVWYGNVHMRDYSVVWYETDTVGTSTNQEFTIGKDSFVSLKNATNGRTFPAVYQYYNSMTIGENSTYNSNMYGNSVRYDKTGSGMTVKSGATVNLLSRGTGSVMQFQASSTYFNLEPGGSVYIVGSTTSPIVDITGGSNKTFTMNSPKGFDIRNKNTGSTSNSPAVSTGTSQTNTFTINDSDIDLWKLQTDVNGPSTETYAKVASFSVKAAGNTANVTTTEPGLSAFVPTNYRRIAGMNTNPVAEWVPVTDADYSYKARVMIGSTPKDEFDEYGNVILQPVYASENQAYVTYQDTFGVEHVAYTDSNGYATVTDTRFNLAGQAISAIATRGPWVSEEPAVTTIIDVTPPEPATVTEGKVTNANKQLIGSGAEANAKVFVQINGGELVASGTVAADGSWSYDLPAYLTTGDKVKIYLQDNAGAAPADLNPIPPTTNSADGNINPSTTALSYRDAVFQPATEYTVVDVLPDNPAITKTVATYRKGTEVTTTQVGDTLLYTITAKNDKASAFDSLWSDVVITDTLPAGLNFDSATAEVTVGGTVIDETQYNYNSETRLLTVNVGDLATQESTIVTFKTTVARTAVGQVITNTAKAEGDSPREVEPFEPGPEISGKEHQTYSKTSTGADNPGGNVYGTLELLSAPTAIDFGEVTYSGQGIRVNNPTKTGADLVVQDSRATRENWTLTAKLTTPMTEVGGSGYVLNNALRYVYQGNEIILNAGAQNVMVHTNDSDEYNVSSTWSDTGDGFKLQINAEDLKATGDYRGEILWQLSDTPAEDMP